VHSSRAPIVEDKGLCGGVNTAVAKQVRMGISAEEAKGNISKVRKGWGMGMENIFIIYNIL
jgi:F0F1-type ATP synthase gamma subunit